MTLTQRMDMARHLWRTTGQACYQEEYLALADLAAMIQSRSPHYLRALEDGLAIVRCGEQEPPSRPRVDDAAQRMTEIIQAALDTFPPAERARLLTTYLYLAKKPSRREPED